MYRKRASRHVPCIPPHVTFLVFAGRRALERLAADGPLLGRIRRAAHATAQEYGWDGLAAKRLELYERSIDERTTLTATSSRIACRSEPAND